MKSELQDLLHHALSSVPFYKRFQKELDCKEIKLENFPPVSKKSMIDNLDDFLSDAYSGYRKISDHHSDNRKVLIYEFTSGTSGYPLKCYKTVSERTKLGLSLYKKRKAIYPNFTNDKMFCFIHNTGYRSNSYTDSLGNLSDDNIRKVLLYLRDEVRPLVLHGNPMLFLYYATFIKNSRFDLKSWKIEFIESVSEGFSHDEKRFVEEQFRTRVIDCYGCLECYNIAYECIEGALHINENVIVEIIDPDTQQFITEKGREGEIVITSLVNRAQPIIRYKTSDIGYISTDKCVCGSESEIVCLTGKRKVDFIKLLYKTDDPRLNICGYDFFATVMDRLIKEGHDYVSWSNVIQQELDLFDVLFIKKRTFSDTFFKLFKEYSEQELGMPIRIEFIEKTEEEVLLINRKNRVFRSNLQND